MLSHYLERSNNPGISGFNTLPYIPKSHLDGFVSVSRLDLNVFVP